VASTGIVVHPAHRASGILGNTELILEREAILKLDGSSSRAVKSWAANLEGDVLETTVLLVGTVDLTTELLPIGEVKDVALSVLDAEIGLGRTCDFSVAEGNLWTGCTAVGGAWCRLGIWHLGNNALGSVEDLVTGAAASFAGDRINLPRVSNGSATASGLWNH